MRKLFLGLIAATLLAALPVSSQAGVFVSVTIAPPVLPVYVQPPIPGPGYMWTPGYWAWDGDYGDYYWVPGTWVLAPVGLLWTPGYWGWVDGAYLWHGGYWGPHVGFYGGVDYGYGYGGVGFAGGEWRGGQLYYNRSVTNVSTTNITNVYNRTVVNNVNVTHVSYNGGSGGTMARPNSEQIAAEHERHEGPIQSQTEHQSMASHDNSMRASFNGGHPSIAATARPTAFTGPGVVASRGAMTHGGSAEGGRMEGGRGPQSAGSTHTQTHSGPYPQSGSYSQPHGANAPQSSAYSQSREPRGNFPQSGGYSQPRGNNPQSGAFPQSRAEPREPRAEAPRAAPFSPQARPEPAVSSSSPARIRAAASRGSGPTTARTIRTESSQAAPRYTTRRSHCAMSVTSWGQTLCGIAYACHSTG
jgi:hypothetical protein